MIESAYAQLQGGEFEGAVEAFTDCLLVDPHQAQSHYGRGMAHLKLKQWALAIGDFCRAKELDPSNPDYGVALATSLASDSQVYEAIEVFEELLAAHPRYVRGHLQLAQLYYRLGTIAKGHAQLDAALKARPSLAERQVIAQLQAEQRVLDKKRYYRPDFEALRRQNQTESPALLKRIARFFAACRGA